MQVIFFTITTFWIAFPLSFQIRDLIRGNLFLRIIRIVGMNIPYLAVFSVLPIPQYDFRVKTSLIIISALAALIYTTFDIQNLRNSMNKYLFHYLKKVEGKNLVSRGGEVIIVPVIEELFFRGVVPLEASVKEIIIVFGVSTLLFLVAHYIGQSKEMYYHIKLILLSLMAMGLYFWTKNILYSIIFHALCNLPWFVTNLKMYLYEKNKGESHTI
ncbi:CPBP family intramembrane glutamic endopeptidase [Lactococcus sp. KTH0-1S]|uniref:CPBP family intramembrane glutamic endopeptidase n=1 Tax=Lactococcus sp. KTH0-1S TaxID=3438232 RepID=UPI00403D2D1D